MVTSRTSPLSTAERKSENASDACGPRFGAEPWNRLKSASKSKAMMTQSAKLREKFNAVRPFPKARRPRRYRHYAEGALFRSRYVPDPRAPAFFPNYIVSSD